MHDEREIRELPIRIRRTEDGRGRARSETTVICPQNGTSVPLDQCAECEMKGEIRIAETAGASCVRCHAPVETGLATPEEAAWKRLCQLDLALPSLLESTPVSTLMTDHVTCVTRDLALEELADLFLARRISGAPVVDSKGHPIGMVSKTDLVREHFEAARFDDELSLRDGKVADVMTESAIRLLETASLAQASALMAQEGIHRMPIVSEAGQVVGILSALDVVRWLAVRAGYMLPSRKP
jgi:CBS domain-containing protein